MNTGSNGGDPQQSGKPRRSYLYRYIIIAVIFTLVCIVYIVSIGRIQYEAGLKVDDGDDDLTTRTVAIQAVRGEIYDRNGKPLVTNEYTYSLIFDYAAMAETYPEQNAAILAVADLIDAAGARDLLPEPNCPLEGIYPYISYNKTLLADENIAARLSRILKDNELSPDADAAALSTALALKYKMITKKGEMLYTGEQITELLRVRYEMEIVRFSRVEPYIFAVGIDLPIITRVSELNIRGTDITVSYKRFYHYPGYASHILGRISKIFAEDAEYYTEQGYPVTAVVGVDGCELAFEKYLRGMDGVLTITEDADGNFVNVEVTKEPEAGQDVYLTIDIGLQITAEDALRDNILKINEDAALTEEKLDGEDADAGAIVAQKASTGEILAIASYPTYDLSTFNTDYTDLANDTRKPLFNRALEGTYAPGSTFKVGVAVAALTEGIRTESGETFTPTTLIKTEGKYTFYDDYQPVCWIYNERTHRSHGTINVKTAIQESCNCFFYELGRLLGIDLINKYCRIYGLGQATGIEVREASGVLADGDYSRSQGLGPWTGGNTIATAIGQMYNQFTPLQIAGYIATIANGGNRYAAHLLSEVRDFGGETTQKTEPAVLDSLKMSSLNYKTIIGAMSSVIENGSASQAFSDCSYTVGGKTGTAQISKTASDNAVFVAFAPLESPEIVVTCVIERGSKGLKAAQSVRTVLDKYFTDKDVPDTGGGGAG